MKHQLNPLRVAAVMLASLFIFACNTARKAQKQVAKIQLQHPEVLADAAHKFYPCVIKPVSSVTTNRPDSSIGLIIDSLKSQAANYQTLAKNAVKRADSAILASYRNKDTACANLLIDLKSLISDLREKYYGTVETLSALKYKYNYLKEHPQIVTNTVSVSDSAQVYLLTTERDNYKNQLAGKDGEIKQLSKLNVKKNIALTIMGIVIIGGVFIKLKS